LLKRKQIQHFCGEFASRCTAFGRLLTVRTFKCCIDSQSVVMKRCRYDLLPFYARLVASLHPCMPSIANDLALMLKTDFRYHVSLSSFTCSVCTVLYVKLWHVTRRLFVLTFLHDNYLCSNVFNIPDIKDQISIIQK